MIDGSLEVNVSTATLDFLSVYVTAKSGRNCSNKEFVLSYWPLYQPTPLAENAKWKRVVVNVETQFVHKWQGYKPELNAYKKPLHIMGLPYNVYLRFELHIFCDDHFDKFVKTIPPQSGSEYCVFGLQIL